MKEKLRALGLVVALIPLTYVVARYPDETRLFFLHVVAVILLDILVATIKFSWPKDKSKDD